MAMRSTLQSRAHRNGPPLPDAPLLPAVIGLVDWASPGFAHAYRAIGLGDAAGFFISTNVFRH